MTASKYLLDNLKTQTVLLFVFIDYLFLIKIILVLVSMKILKKLGPFVTLDLI